MKWSVKRGKNIIWNDAECVSALWEFGVWEACR